MPEGGRDERIGQMPHHQLDIVAQVLNVKYILTLIVLDHASVYT